MKACSICGGKAVNGGTRCATHQQPRRNEQMNRQVVLAGGPCSICGKPATADDPLTADHTIPLAYGGADQTWNLRPAHRSCNSRAGAAITNAAA